MPEPARAGRREWIGLAILALPAALISMDLSVLHLAVPHLSADLRPTSSELLWIVDIYGFMIAGLLIPMGTLGDRIGRRRLLLIGATAFAAASVLAALSTSATMLIATRALLGVAGATLMPSTMALIRNMFHDPAQRTTAISLWMLGFMVGGALGPVIGGVVLEWFEWRAVFLLALPVMAGLLVAGPLLLPEYRAPHPGRFDLLSAGMSLVAVLGVIQAVKQSAEHGLSWEAAAFATGGVLVGVAFARRQQRAADPLIELGLFANRRFSISVLTNTVAFCLVLGMFLFTAQYLQLVVGLSALEAGLWLLPQTVASVVGAMAASTLARRLRPGTLLASGLGVAAAGFLILTQADRGGDLAVVTIGMVVAMLGVVPIFALATDLILAAAPPERAGAASGLSETGSELGGALGVALLGAAGTAVYRSEVADRLPDGLPAEAAAAARETLGGTVAIVDRIPAELVPAVLDVTRGAFVSGLHAAALIAAAGSALLAVVVACSLRDAALDGEREGGDVAVAAANA